MKLGTQVGLGPGHIALDGDPAPPPPKGHSPQFSAHICCGQMAAWIKMPLGMEVGLGPGDVVRWGPWSLLPKKGRIPPTFLAHVRCGQTAGWIKMALGTELGLSPGDFFVSAAEKSVTVQTKKTYEQTNKITHSKLSISPTTVWWNNNRYLLELVLHHGGKTGGVDMMRRNHVTVSPKDLVI